MKNPNGPSIEDQEVWHEELAAKESKTPFLSAVADLEGQHESLGYEYDKLLRKQGWKYVCDTPGSVWMWQKQLPDGRIVLCSQSLAISFEQELCGEEVELDPSDIY